MESYGSPHLSCALISPRFSQTTHAAHALPPVKRSIPQTLEAAAIKHAADALYLPLQLPLPWSLLQALLPLPYKRITVTFMPIMDTTIATNPGTFLTSNMLRPVQSIACLLLCLLPFWLPVSCTPQKETRIPWQSIQGRDRTVTRPLYRVRAPLEWVRVDPLDEVDLSDTTLPISTFYLHDAASSIRITLHTFPYTRATERIPPEAQVARWQRQHTNPSYPVTVTPMAHGGFQGLCFEGEGVLAWSMKVGDPYEQYFTSHPPKNPFTRALRADYTIKAVGSPESIETHHEELCAFARSFEWIEEMPHP